MIHRPWTEDEEFYLTAHYGKVPAKKLAEKLNRTHFAILRKAVNIGIATQHNQRRRWTKKETKFLEAHYESKGVHYVAKNLNRTLNSVKRKSHTLGLNSYCNDAISLKTLIHCFNTNDHIAKKWIANGLKHRRINRGQIKGYRIFADDFWKWAKDHKDQIPWYKYQKGSLLPEPEWLKEELKNAQPKNVRMPVPKSDIEYVLAKRKLGMTFKEIGKALNRSASSVRNIYDRYKEEPK